MWSRSRAALKIKTRKQQKNNLRESEWKAKKPQTIQISKNFAIHSKVLVLHISKKKCVVAFIVMSQIWNHLPEEIRLAELVTTFESLLID